MPSSWTIDQIVANFRRSPYDQSFWSDPAHITYAFPTDASGYWPDYGPEPDGFSAFSASQQQSALLAMQLWMDVANITITQSQDPNSGNLRFANTNALDPGIAAISFMPGLSGSYSGDMWFDSTYAPNLSPILGSYGFLTLLHEIGHALGLPHPGDYNTVDGFSYGADAFYAEDTVQYTVMSYFDAINTGANHKIGSTTYFGTTPLLDDIAAIQFIYGANTSTRTSNTVYGYNSNAGSSVFDFTVNTHPIIAIWDAGGTDTIDLSGSNQIALIDLNQGAFSNVLGFTKNLTIAYGATIENAVGGSNDDTLVGNSANNILIGGSGKDRIYGGAGDDTLTGGAGSDIFAFTMLSDLSANGDHITDFGGEKLDLSGIGGLHFIGTAAFSGVAGQYRYAYSLNTTIIAIDINGDGIGDDKITIDNGRFAFAETSSGSNILGASSAVPPPLLVSASPTDNATNIAPSANLVLRFSVPVSFGVGNIEIHRVSDGSLVQSISITDTSQVSIGGSVNDVVTINPTSDLVPGTAYYVLIDANIVHDVDGVGFAGISSTTTFNFSTTSSDITPPTLVSIDPSDDAANVALDTNITLTFSEAVVAGTGHFNITKGLDNIVQSIPLSDASQVTVSGNIVTINPAADLDPGTNYHLSYGGTLFTDLSGNVFTGFGSSTYFNFTTTGTDSEAPIIAAISPLGVDATKVAVGSNFVFTFSEGVKAGTGNIVIHKWLDDSIVTTISVTDASQVTFSGNTVVVNPSLDLNAGTSYYVIIASSVITDLVGNSFAGFPSKNAYSFLTAAVIDSTPPTLSSTAPLDDATGVAVGANFMLTFSEAVNAGSGNFIIHKTSDINAVETISITDASQVTISGNQVIINPTVDLESDTDYYVTLASGAIKDLSNNPFAGIFSTTAFNFTTVAATDSTPPTLSSTSPLDNATGVAVGANIVLNFDEAVQAGTGNFLIKKSSDDTTVATIAVTDASQVSISGNQVTINPTSNLASGIGYYVTLASGVIQDLAGNSYAGISSTTAFNFTTFIDNTAPTLSSSSPTDNATGVAIGANIVLTFSEAVKAGSGNFVIKRTSNGSTVATIAVADANQVSISGNQVTINPTNNLLASTGYYLTLVSGVIKDIAGNNYAGISSSTALNFTTGAGDTTAPTLSSTSPLDNATGVAVGANLVLTFNEAVKAGSGNILIRKSSDDSTVATIAVTDASQVSIAGSAVTINSTADLLPGTGYYLTLTAGVIEDLAGNDYAGISSTTALNFTTAAAADVTPPTLPLTSPLDDATNVAVGANIVLTFNEAVKAGSGNIVIHKSSDDSVVATIAVGDASQVSIAGSAVTINPTADLLPSTGYYLTLAPGVIEDLAGNDYAGISSTTAFNFTTAAAVDSTPPTLSLTSPLDDATGVAVGANIVLTFNEAVKAGSGNILIKNSVDNSTVATIAVGDSSQVNISGSTVTINSTADLAAGTGYYVTLASGVITDLANNPYAGISSTTAFNFTTAAAADVTPPSLSSTSPLDNATNVALGANIVLNFNEAVQAGSGNILIKKTSDNSTVTTIAVGDASQVNISGSTVTINPTADLLPGTGYYVTLASGVIQDLANNAFAGISSTTAFNFTTLTPADDYANTTATTGIVAVGGSVTGLVGTVNDADWFKVALTAGQTYYFSLEGSGTGQGTLANPLLKLINGSGALILSDDDSGGSLNSLVTYTPSSSGNYFLAARASDTGIGGYKLSVSTGAPPSDVTPPTLSLTSPLDDATGVTVGANIVLTFNEAVKAGSGNIVIHKSSDDSTVATIAVTDASQASIAGSTVTINPTADLAAGTGYYLTLASGVIEDLAGNDFAGISSTTAFNFTTAALVDSTPPTLSTTSPLDDATGVAVGANLVLTFNEAVQAGTGNIVIHKSSDDSVVATIAVGDASQVNISGSVVTINPTADLTAGTGYYLTLAAGVIEDLAGNDYAGISSTTVFNFTTAAAADSTPPTLSLTSPLDNATGVAIGANIILNFNEAVKAGSGNIVIHKSSDDSTVATIAVTDASQISIASSTVTINPTADLAAGIGYYVTLASGVIEDLTGNDYAGISSTTAFNFTTAAGGGDVTPPALSSTSPLDNASNVALASNIAMTFNEAIAAGIGTIDIYYQASNTLAKSISVGDASQVSIAGSTLTLNPVTDLKPGTAYYVLVSSGVVEDTAGNDFAGIASSTAFNFTTLTPVDDYTNTTATTGTLALGVPKTGMVGSNGDADWFKMTLTAGQTYYFSLEGEDTGQGTLTNPLLKLINSSGTLILSDDDSGTGLNSLISYMPSSSGTYYLAARASDTGTGSYTVSMSQSPPAAPQSLAAPILLEAGSDSFVFEPSQQQHDSLHFLPGGLSAAEFLDHLQQEYHLLSHNADLFSSEPIISIGEHGLVVHVGAVNFHATSIFDHDYLGSF